MKHVFSKYRLALVRESNSQGDFYSKKKVTSPGELAFMLEEIFDLSNEPEEVCVMLCLDTKHKIIGAFEVSRGNINSSIVHPREIFKRAVLNNAHAIVISHNHPSGDCDPSSEDVKITKRIAEAGELLGVKLLDHIIIGDNEYRSLKEMEVI